MALVISLKDWKAGEAAAISGVSPELQRQWRRLGVLTPLTEKKKTKFNILTIGFVVAARTLIDAGAGHRKIQPLINGLGGQIMHTALLRGELEARAPVSREEVQSEILRWGAPAVAARMSHRYFAFRSDEDAVGSNHRAIHFSEFSTFERWLSTGVEQTEYEDDRDVFTGTKIRHPPLTADEIAEDEEWRRGHPPELPLPPAAAATIIDVEAVASRLLDSLGRVYGQVWDNERDLESERFRALSSSAKHIGDQLEAMVVAFRADLDQAFAERDHIAVERMRPHSEASARDVERRAAEVEARIDRLLEEREARWEGANALRTEHSALIQEMDIELASLREQTNHKVSSYRVDSFDLGLRKVELKRRLRKGRADGST